MDRHSDSANTMRVVILDNEQVGTCLRVLMEEWTKYDDQRNRQTPDHQRSTIKRQEHIEGIMALLRNSPRRTHGETGSETTA